MNGDGILKIEADTDDNNEDDNSRIEFIHDGGYQNSAIGLNISLHCGPPISVSNSTKRRYKCQVTTKRWKAMTCLHYERA